MKKQEFRVDGAFKYNTKSPLRWVVSHIMRYPHFLLFILVFSIINNIAYGNIQVYIGKGFEVVSASGWLLKSLLFVALVVGGSALTQGLCGLGRNFCFEFVAQRIERDAREEFYISLLGKSQTFHGKQRLGDIMARATNDVRHLNLMMNPGLLLILDSGLGFIIPTIMVGLLHPLLLVLPFLFLIFLILTVVEYNKRLIPVSVKQREQFGVMNTGLQEAIEGIEVVKTNVKEHYEWNKFTQDARVYRDYFVKQGIIQAKYWPMLVFSIFMGLAFFYGLLLWKYEIITLGKVIGFVGLFNTYRYTTFISIFSFNLIQLGRASSTRILKLINHDTELDENIHGVKQELQGKITFENVSFSFEDNQVLRNINFSVNPGETIAIVGQTGSGKTTLTRLINRIFDVNDGSVFIDDINIKEWNMESLRSQISTIEQDIFLFSASIKENIAFGDINAGDEQIIHSAKEAQAHNFISGFTDGYDTEIGERGVTLSGGQKQRIAIARAFLTNPKILILDDSTSAIDSATEDEIQKAMKKISSQRTTFIITHRLSQIRWADKIIVLKKGRLVDCGKHEELLGRCDDYRRIFS